MGFLLTLIVIIILFRVLFRYLPSILLWYTRKRADKMYGNTRKEKRDKKEGTTFVSRDTSSQKKIVTKDVGEYVDYEQVKEKENENI